MNAQNVLGKIKLSLNRLPIYKYRYYWFLVPAVILFLALTLGAIYSSPGVFGNFANVGIDFEGGTVMTVSGLNLDNYDDDRALIGEILSENGIAVSSWQTSGNNSIVVRYANFINNEDFNDRAEEMGAVNNSAALAIEERLQASGRYDNVNIEANPEMINGTARQDTINSSLIAVAVAMALMLIYTAIRFDLFSGIAALANQFHDILMMLALVIIFRIQINSSLIAGLITIVGYSINNTIVIFDRIRGEVKLLKPKGSGRGWGNVRPDFQSIVNTCVSESLTRSLFTSLTTLFTITILACVGVQSLTEFALPIIFGILAGLYSAIFLGPSLWGMMQHAQVYGTKRNPKSSFKKGSTSKADQMIARKKSKKG